MIALFLYGPYPKVCKQLHKENNRIIQLVISKLK